jgi:hypothetical protein
VLKLALVLAPFAALKLIDELMLSRLLTPVLTERLKEASSLSLVLKLALSISLPDALVLLPAEALVLALVETLSLAMVDCSSARLWLTLVDSCSLAAVLSLTLAESSSPVFPLSLVELSSARLWLMLDDSSSLAAVLALSLALAIVDSSSARL